MDRIEEEIIHTFVADNKQDRVIWELNHPKKRKDVIFNRFHSPELFKKECLQPMEYMRADLLEKHLLKLNPNKDVYFMGEAYIGETELRTAVERANQGEICIIYCGNGIGYYRGEEDIGGAPRFLLIGHRK